MDLIIGDEGNFSDSGSDEEANKVKRQMREYEKRYKEQEKKAEQEFKQRK